MVRKSRNHRFDLPPLELRCMQVLWNAGKATVHEIRAGLLPDRPLAYTTVMTVMDRLSRKGAVEREKRGRAHLYRPAVTKEVVREHALKYFVQNFFQGSPDDLRRHLENNRTAANESAPTPAVPEIRSSNAAVPAEADTKPEGVIDTSLL